NRVYAAPHAGRTHGTMESGSRDLDWDEWGTDDNIRKNWSKIRDGGTGTTQVSVTSDWSPGAIVKAILGVVGAVASVIPLIFGGGGSSKSNDPNYGRPEDYPPGGLPPPNAGDSPLGQTVG